MLTDPALDVTKLGGGDLRDGAVGLHGEVDLRNVNKAVPMRPRHGRVDLHDDVFGHLQRSPRHVDRHAERTEAVFFWWRHLKERYVQRKNSVSEERRDFAQKHRNAVCFALLDGFSDVRSDEERIRVKHVGDVRVGVRRVSFRVQVNHVHVGQGGGTSG